MNRAGQSVAARRGRTFAQKQIVSLTEAETKNRTFMQ